MRSRSESRGSECWRARCSPRAQAYIVCRAALGRCPKVSTRVAFDSSQSSISVGIPPSSSCVPRLNMMDDMTIIAPADVTFEIARELPAVLQRGGHVLQPIKCQAWCPAADGIADLELPPSLRSLFTLLPRVVGGIDLLGGGAFRKNAIRIGRTITVSTSEVMAAPVGVFICCYGPWDTCST